MRTASARSLIWFRSGLLIASAARVQGADAFSARERFSSAEFLVQASNIDATREANEPMHAGRSGGRSLWWSWTAPASGIVTINTAGTTFDSLLAVYEGTALPGIRQVAANDNYDNPEPEYNGGISRVSFHAVAGKTYEVALDGKLDASGAVSLRLEYAYTITTVAGQSRFAGTADGVGNAAQFTLPCGIAVDRQGQIYVADTHNDVIRKVLPTGEVTTLAGMPRTAGFADGIGREARFNKPRGIAVDERGNLFVADTDNHVIRRISGEGVVSTVAGMPGARGLADGAGSAARFTHPRGVAVDSVGSIFVADTESYRVRKISPEGVVSTIAGALGSSLLQGPALSVGFEWPMGIVVGPDGSVYVSDLQSRVRKIKDGQVSIVAGGGRLGDGYGEKSGFSRPEGLAIDSAGNLYVADTGYHSIRRISPEGAVTTLAGRLGQQGWDDGTGPEAGFGYFPSFSLAESFAVAGVAVGPEGVLYVADTANCIIRRATRAVAPEVNCSPANLTVNAGDTLVLNAAVKSPVPVTWQWTRNGVLIAGATNALLRRVNATATDRGVYAARATSLVGTVITDEATVEVLSEKVAPSSLRNLSVRSNMRPNETLILGFNASGSGLELLARAVGPGLEGVGVAGAGRDPSLTLFRNSATVAANDNWSSGNDVGGVTGAVSATGAFALLPGSLDAALLESLQAGAHTAHVKLNGDASGIVLAELYDTHLIATERRLTNLSARSHVGQGGERLIAGVVISGTAAKTLLIRAVGPSLAQFGIQDLLQQPKIELFQATRLIQESDGRWDEELFGNVFRQVGAFPLARPSADAVVLVSLMPGVYTIQVSGLRGAIGACLLEVFEVP